MTQLAAIGIGSNLDSTFGGREANLEEAVHRIAALGRIAAVSSFYETDPVGYLDQPKFINGAVLLETELTPHALLQSLLAIERSMGRDRTHAIAKGPRIIDLDLLLMDDIVLETDDLILPHPGLRERLFVLRPLADIAPTMLHPLEHATVLQLLYRAQQT